MVPVSGSIQWDVSVPRHVPRRSGRLHLEGSFAHSHRSYAPSRPTANSDANETKRAQPEGTDSPPSHSSATKPPIAARARMRVRVIESPVHLVIVAIARMTREVASRSVQGWVGANKYLSSLTSCHSPVPTVLPSSSESQVSTCRTLT